ncbi:MAG: hypothetical protein KAR42_08910 [candidate division Zixibacteria bacterium]|nr:hypothetical protein [candidate division Zixibacteria bacterium]
MRKNRLIYQNWIVELGYDPVLGRQDSSQANYNPELISAVSTAMFSLNESESDFIRSFYLQGLTYRQISSITGKDIYRLEAIHHRAVLKLRTRLADYLRKRNLVELSHDKKCPICAHEKAKDINILITRKDKRETWRKIIKTLADEYSIKITTPQMLIGHAKYHI